MEQSLDRAFVIPELISELTQQQIDTPVIHSITYLDEHRKQNLLRKWEHALVEECADMKQDELDTFVKKMKTSRKPTWGLFQKKWGPDDSGNCNSRSVELPPQIIGYVENENVAVYMLYKYFISNGYFIEFEYTWVNTYSHFMPNSKVPTLDNCRKIVHEHVPIKALYYFDSILKNDVPQLRDVFEKDKKFF